MTAIAELAFPLFTIDFEASSLEHMSYPIEIGIARWDGPGSCIAGWSSLIIPTKQWCASQSWTKEAQELHGLSPPDLAHGIPPASALTLANRLANERTAYCDGGSYDMYWLPRLSVAASKSPDFSLGSWGGLIDMLSTCDQETITEWLEDNPSIHRARPDAERLLRALAYAAGETPAIVDIQL